MVVSNHNKIGKLKQLKYLSLQFTNIVEFPDSFYDLEMLEYLNLNETKFEKLDSRIGKLKNLKTLKLTRMRLLKCLPKEIGKLQKLEVFDVTATKELRSLPEELYGIKTLKNICLEDTQINELSKKIGELEQLETLSLHGVISMQTIPKEIGMLKKLKKLDMTGPNEFKELPEEIGGLENLEILILTYWKIKKLPSSIKNLKSLKKLDLRQSDLEMLPDEKEIEGLEALEELDIEATRIKQIPKTLFSLPMLKKLNLSDIELKSIPKEILNLGMEFFVEEKPKENDRKGIFLYNTKSIQTDVKIFKESRRDIIKYYNRFANTTEFYQKVVFLGDGGGGKTTIINRLGKDKRSIPKVTKEIDIIPLIKEIEGKEVCLNIWDLGSQVIRNFWQQLFLTHGAIFVVVINAREEIRAEERARFWLDLIFPYVDSKRILLVINKMDANERFTFDETSIMTMYPQIYSIRKIAARPESKNFKDNFEDFEKDLYSVIKEEMKNSKICNLGKRYELLEGISRIDYEFITKDDYCKLYKKIFGDNQENAEEILKWINDIGKVWKQGRYIFLDIEWVVGILGVLCSCKVNENGEIFLEEFYDRIEEKSAYNKKKDQVELVLRFLAKRKIIEISDEIIFVPFLLKKRKIVITEKQDIKQLRVRIRYNYDALYVLQKFMINFYERAIEISYYEMYFELEDEGDAGYIKVEDKYMYIIVFSEKTEKLCWQIHEVITNIRKIIREIKGIQEKDKDKEVEDNKLGIEIEVEYEKEDKKQWLSYNMLIEMKDKNIKEGYKRGIGVFKVNEVLMKYGYNDDEKGVPMFSNCTFNGPIVAPNGNIEKVIMGDERIEKSLSKSEIEEILNLLKDVDDIRTDLVNVKDDSKKFAEKLRIVLSDTANIATIGSTVFTVIQGILQNIN